MGENAGGEGVSEEEIQHEFEAWQVSETIKRDLRLGRERFWVRQLAGWSAWIIMVIGILVGWLWLWPISERISLGNAVESARVANGLLVHLNFGTGMILFLFAWLILSCILAVLCLRLSPQKFKSAYFLGLYEDTNLRPFNRKALEKMFQSGREYVGSENFFKAWRAAYVSLTWKYAAPLILIGTPLYFSDLHAHSFYSEKGVHISSVIPFKGDRFLPWEDVERVKLGCNQTNGGASLIYETIFTSGKSIRIARARSISERNWLESMELIDAQIARAGATFERWKWVGRDPMHPACLRGYYGQVGLKNSERIQRLLRVGEL